jgi:hypothetical protein
MLDRNNFGVVINATDTSLVVNISMATNRSTAAKFLEGDSLNWFGTLYEIVDIAADENVTLGSTSEVTATLGESFTIGGETFNFIDVDSNSQKAQITDAGGTTYTINTTYTTIGTLDLRVKSGSIFSGRTGASAIFETVTNSYKFAVGDAFPLDTEFLVDSMTVNTTALTVDSAIALKNNITYSLGAKSAKADIAEGLQFIYNDNTANNAAANTAVTTGGTGQINITETAGVTLDIKANDTGTTSFENVTLTLPGSEFYNWTGEYSQKITSLSDGDEGGVNNYIYLRDPVTSYYELRIKPVATQEVAYAIPDTTTNLTSSSYSGNWAEPVTTAWVNHTTPSGVKVALVDDGTDKYVELKVAAVQIQIDDSTNHFGRKDVSWSAAKYSQYGPRVLWTASGDTGTVTVTEPTGGVLSALITFQSDDDAVFNKKADVTFGGTVISATGNSSSSDQQNTNFGSWIGLLADSDGIETDGADTDDTVAIATPQKKIEIGVGAMQNTTSTLDTDETDDTYPISDIFGNTTVTLLSGTGSSASINKITPGIAKFDYDITTSALTKPVVLVGGSAINSLVKSLVDGGSIDYTDLIAQGTGHAQVDLVENAFNSQAALVIAGMTGDDTLMAAKAVAGAMLNGQPFDFADYAMAALILNTGTSVVNDVAVIETEEETNETA